MKDKIFELFAEIKCNVKTTVFAKNITSALQYVDTIPRDEWIPSEAQPDSLYVVAIEEKTKINGG